MLNLFLFAIILMYTHISRYRHTHKSVLPTADLEVLGLPGSAMLSPSGHGRMHSFNTLLMEGRRIDPKQFDTFRERADPFIILQGLV